MAISRKISKKDPTTLWLESKKGYLIIDGFEHIHSFKFAKPIFGGHILFNAKDWELHELEDSEFINTTPIVISQNLKVVFQAIRPYYGVKMKGYVFGRNFICSVDLPRIINLLQINQKELFRTNVNLEDPSVIAVYNLDSQKVSLIEDIGLPGEDLVPIKVFGKKWGFISLDDFNSLKFDNYKIPPIYEFAVGFIEGYSKVKFNGYFGFINSEGMTMIPFEYDDALSFQNGKASVAISNYKNNPGKIYNDFSWFDIDSNNCRCSRRRFDSLRIETDELFGPVLKSTISQFGLEGIVELKKISHQFDDFEVASRFDRYMNSSSGIVIDPIKLDFDLTQMEIDFITGKNSLLEKYGKEYFIWKKDCQREIAARKTEQARRDLEDNLTYKEPLQDKSDKSNIDFNENWEWNID